MRRIKFVILLIVLMVLIVLTGCNLDLSAEHNGDPSDNTVTTVSDVTEEITDGIEGTGEYEPNPYQE